MTWQRSFVAPNRKHIITINRERGFERIEWWGDIRRRAKALCRNPWIRDVYQGWGGVRPKADLVLSYGKLIGLASVTPGDKLHSF